MVANATVRRLGVAAIGIVGGLAVTVACSSSTSGKPAGGGGAPSLSVPASLSASLPASLPVSLPASLPVSLPASLPATGPALGGSQFCKDIAGQGSLAGLGSATDLTKLLDAWDKLAAEAPAEIKSDVQAVADYLHGAAKGQIDPSAATKLSGAAQNIGVYVATNCH